MNARYYNGDDDRDVWGESGPDDCGCWSCGVDADTPCLTGCECAHCKRMAARSAETPVVLSPVDVYAYAIRAGLDALAEIQRGRS